MDYYVIKYKDGYINISYELQTTTNIYCATHFASKLDAENYILNYCAKYKLSAKEFKTIKHKYFIY